MSAAVSRHRRASSPGEEAVGGFFFDFEAIRTASSEREYRVAIKIGNETTHFIVRWRRVASMALCRRKATGRRSRAFRRLHIHFRLLVRLFLAQPPSVVLVLLDLVELLLATLVCVFVLR